MAETLVFLLSSFWLGAVHAATPGHGKTIAAAYIVGARGRPVDALALGIFVTLSHTSGIVLVAVLASLGSAWLIPHRVEAYLALVTGVLVIGIGLWMLGAQRAALWPATEPGPHDPAEVGHAHPLDEAVKQETWGLVGVLDGERTVFSTCAACHSAGWRPPAFAGMN